MRFLLDTHIVLWWLSDDSKLSRDYWSVIADESNEIFVSSVSVAEITIKSSLGKLTMPDELLEVLAESGFDELDFTSAHALKLKELPWHHRDPFDRMLISQAAADGLTLMTADAR